MNVFRPKQFLQLIFLYTCLCHVLGAEFIRVCYFTNWSKWKTSTLAKFDVENIDPAICTHLVYAFGKIDAASANLAAMEPADIPRYKSFNDLKAKNSKLKMLLSIGGQNEAGVGFSKVSSNDSLLNAFANNAVGFLRNHSFDGVDLDWEYPNKTTNNDFIKMLKSLRSAFDNETTSSRLMLTIAAPAGEDHIRDGFNVSEIDKYVDFVNIMSYDYSTGDSTVAVFNSPLYSRNDVRFDSRLNTNWTVQFYRQLGLRYSKMVVGFTGIGRWLVLSNVSLTEVGSPVTGVKRKGPDYQFEAGLAFPEVCKMLENSSTRRVFDEVQKMPYLVMGDNWVGYEDVQSIGVKTEWAVQIGAAGIMFWSLDQDDFNGVACNQGKYPLMSKIISITDELTTTTTSTSTTPSSTTPSAQSVTTLRVPTEKPVLRDCGSGLAVLSLPIIMLIHLITMTLF